MTNEINKIKKETEILMASILNSAEAQKILNDMSELNLDDLRSGILCESWDQWNSMNLELEYFGDIGEYKREDLKLLGVKLKVTIPNCVMISQTYSMEGYNGFYVYIVDGKDGNFYETVEEVVEYLTENASGRPIFNYVCDSGEEGYNYIGKSPQLLLNYF